MNAAEEQCAFAAEVAAVKAWWATPRFAGATRPYSAEDVVSKRGTLQQSYASATQAKKLWRLLQAHKAARTCSFTYGALDPIQVGFPLALVS